MEKISEGQSVGIGNQVTTSAPTFVPEVVSLEGLPSVQRIYQPLDGREVMNAVLGHLRAEMERSYKFPEHIAMERARWKFILKVDYDSYNNNQIGLKVEGGLEVGRAAEGEQIPEHVVRDKPSLGIEAPVTQVEHVHIEGQQTDKEIAPDEVREMTGQPIPVLKQGGGVVKVAGKLLTTKKR